MLYTISPPGTKKIELGRLALSPTGPFLPDLAVEKGWVKLRDNAGRNEESEEATALLEKLKQLEPKAKADSEGVWASSGETIETKYDVSDAHALVDQWKGREVDGIFPNLTESMYQDLPLTITQQSWRECLPEIVLLCDCY